MKKSCMDEINEVFLTIRPSETKFILDMKLQTDCFQPKDEIVFRDSSGRILGRIINVR